MVSTIAESGADSVFLLHSGLMRLFRRPAQGYDLHSLTSGRADKAYKIVRKIYGQRKTVVKRRIKERTQNYD